MIMQDQPVVLYNTEKKEKMGIFRTPSIAARYLYKDNFVMQSTARVAVAASKNSRICNSIFKFKIAVRYAKSVDIEQLSDLDFILLKSYPTPFENKMLGFDAGSLRKQANKIIK